VRATEPIEYPIVAKPNDRIYEIHQSRSRKPSNVVARYIDYYTEPGDIVFDPFAGSGVTAIEAVRAGRKGIAVDLDPVSTFISRWTVKPLNLDKTEAAFAAIAPSIETQIAPLYETTCGRCSKIREKGIISHTIWKEENGTSRPEQIWYGTSRHKSRISKKPDDEDLALLKRIDSEPLPYWVPTSRFAYNGRSFLKADKSAPTVDALFTRRNLRALSIIWNEINKVTYKDGRDFLRFVFSSSLSKASKLNRENVGGPKSKGRGWTVHAYWVPPENFEQNPWEDFQRYVHAALDTKRVGMKDIPDFREGRQFGDLLDNRANALLLTQSALRLNPAIPDESVDYVFTDPPYGGTIQYMELSAMWAAWLGLPLNFKEEVTINAQQEKSFEDYDRMLHSAFREVYRVLKRGRWLTVTFHSTSVRTYNSIIRAVVSAGFDLRKIVYQPPSTKETFNQTLNPHGTAAGDYYIQFSKPAVARSTPATRPDAEQYRRVVIGAVRHIIAERGEPTPYQVIFNGIYAELNKYGLLMIAEPEEVQRIVKSCGEFMFLPNEGWWLKDPASAQLNVVPLHERVERSILQRLRRDVTVRFDDILQEIFLNFPNALTPSPPSIVGILEEYAERLSDGSWQLKPAVRIDESDHNRMVGYLAELGTKAGFDVWVGQPEQAYVYRGQPLSRLSLDDLRIPGLSEEALEALRNVDVIWLENHLPRFLFEVETTTQISEAIVRGSYYTDPGVRRFFVIPRRRETLLDKKVSAPVFRGRVQEYGWSFMRFEAIERLYEESEHKRSILPTQVLELAQALKTSKARQTRLSVPDEP
jgi:16S rRNA G966 N2-methylase RsmD